MGMDHGFFSRYDRREVTEVNTMMQTTEDKVRRGKM